MAGTFSSVFAPEPDANDATVPVSVLYDDPQGEEESQDEAGFSARGFRESEDDGSTDEVGVLGGPGAPSGQPEPYSNGGSPDGDAGSF